MKLLRPNQKQSLPRSFPGTTKNQRKAARIVGAPIVDRIDQFRNKI